MKFLEAKDQGMLDQQKLMNLVEMVFSPLNEEEILSLAFKESHRTGHSIEKLRNHFIQKNQENPKMMRSFFNKIIKGDHVETSNRSN